MTVLSAVLLGFLLDCVFGDPRFLWHPICAIGNLVASSEKLIRGAFPKTKNGELAGGIIVWFCVVLPSFLVPLAILALAVRINFWLGFTIHTFFCYQIFAAKSLKTESMRVYNALKEKDLPKSRECLSWIVGRDTAELTEQQVIKAAVETVAENTTDGVVSPMIYALIGGAPLAFFYKAVNTLDSMVGYRNEKYIYFGRFSARADDVFNFIPARVTALLMIAASFLLRLNGRAAARIFLRDRKKHKSPNSAQTESVCAGALGIELGGAACYFGVVHEKPTIGENLRRLSLEDIKIANRLMYLTGLLALIIFGGCRFLIFR